MRLNEISDNKAQPVDGYGPGFFRIGGTVLEGPVLLLPAGIVPWAGYQERDGLIAAADAIDVLIVGTGAAIAQIPPDFRSAMEGAGVGVEIMASPAACRTYNVLLSEGRRVGLALIPV